jgi:hypothetical protein
VWLAEVTAALCRADALVHQARKTNVVTRLPVVKLGSGVTALGRNYDEMARAARTAHQDGSDDGMSGLG